MDDSMIPPMIGTGNHVVVTHWKERTEAAEAKLAQPLVDRIARLEDVLIDVAGLLRDMGQTLSWSTAGQRLNNPGQVVRDAQRRVKAFADAVNEERLRE